MPSSINSLMKSFGKIFLFLLLLSAIAAVAYFSIEHDPAIALKTYLENRVQPLVFLLFIFLLPLLGAPISIFLVLVGMKFGIIPGLLVAATAMLFHMSITYLLLHRFFGRRLNDLLARLHISIPALLPKDASKWPAFLFMLIPGPPYVVKNIVLALTEMDFLPYLVINWTAQFSMSIPLIIVGKAVIDMNPAILTLAVFLVIVFYLLQQFIRKTVQSPRSNGSTTSDK